MGVIRAWINCGFGKPNDEAGRGLVQHIRQRAIDGMQQQHMSAALVEVMDEG